MSEHGAISQEQDGYPALREIATMNIERAQTSKHGAISHQQDGYPGLREIATMSTGVTA